MGYTVPNSLGLVGALRMPGPIVGAALNGGRSRAEHPRIPQSPEELALAAREAVDAGAAILHLHAYGETGRETLASNACAAALQAVRGACPGYPISLSTSAEIEPDPQRRAAMVAQWTVLPDLVTANQGDPGIVELCYQLLNRGVSIEAGLLAEDDAERFVASGLADRCARILVEPLDPDPREACERADRIEGIVRDAGITLPQMHHGDGIASWAVNARAIAAGHDVRTGLEDTPVLPNGTPAWDNGELVSAAMELVRSHAPKA